MTPLQVSEFMCWQFKNSLMESLKMMSFRKKKKNSGWRYQKSILENNYIFWGYKDVHNEFLV